MIKKDYPAFCFIGLPQAGKSTASKELSERTGLKRGTCSDIIYRILAKTEGLPFGDWHEVTPEGEKDNVRNKLILLGNALSDEMPHIFPMLLLSNGCMIVDGMRKKKELHAFRSYCKKKNQELIVVWVSRPDSPAIGDNTELTPSDADHMVNATDRDDLRLALDELASRFEHEEVITPQVREGDINLDDDKWDKELVTLGSRCPLCKKSGVWRSGVYFDHQMRCVNDACSGCVWTPGAIHSIFKPKEDNE